MRLNIEHKRGQTFISVHDNDRVIASASGKDAPEAAVYLQQQVDRIAEQTRELLVDANLAPVKRGKAG